MNKENVQFSILGGQVFEEAVARLDGGALSAGVGDWNMAKGSLRILKRVSGVPSLGVCESCGTQFSADPRHLGQAGVQQQFNAHKCEVAESPAPVAKTQTAKVAAK